MARRGFPEITHSQNYENNAKHGRTVHFAEISLAGQNKLCQMLEYIIENKFYHVEWDVP